MKRAHTLVDHTVSAALAAATLLATAYAASAAGSRIARVLAQGALLYLGNTRG